MKKSRKAVSIILSVAMLATLLTGCGGKDNNSGNSKNATTNDKSTVNENTNKSDSEDKQNTSKDPITLTFYNTDGEEDPWTDPVAQALTEATGVTLDTEYPVDGSDQMISLMIASGEYPDIIFAKGDGDALIEAGALIDMTDLINEYGPNIKKLYGDTYMKRLRYSADDPCIYQLCSNQVGTESYTTSGTAQLQYDVLAENDYQIPKTLEEYEKMIKDYMEKYPQIDGLDTIGLTLSCADWHWYITLANPAGFIADGSPDNGQWIINDNNNYQATYKHSTEAEKEYFRWLNRMYNEGILDKDFATQTHDDYIAKISTGRVLGLLDTNWDYADAERVLESDGKYERTYAGLPVTIDENTKCSTLMDQGLNVGWGVGITTACKDPVRAIQYIDYLCSDEGQVLVNWGIEGVNYQIDEEGHRYRTEEEINRANTDTNYKKTTGVGFHNYPFPGYGNAMYDETGSCYVTGSKDSTVAEYNEAEKAACKAWGVDLLVDIFPQPEEFTIPNYAAVWAQSLPADFNDIQTTLDDIAWPGLIACVIASESDFDSKWDEMQSKLEKAGREKAENMLTELIQAQVDFWTE